MEIRYQYTNAELFEKIKGYRRDFHRYPETGWTEYRTSWRIAECLKELGYEVFVGDEVCGMNARMGLPSEEVAASCERRAREEGVPESYMERMHGGCTGVVGVIHGLADAKAGRGMPGSTVESAARVMSGLAVERTGRAMHGSVAIRFDIDALPMQERETEYNREYRSKHDEVMHACGHDGHAAAGLGLAEVLSLHRDKFCGEVRLIFQPAEEGCRGAKAVVEKGWLEDVNLFYSGHIGIGCRHIGEIAACDRGFYATTKVDVHFHGKSAHAAKCPEEGRNALLAGALFTVLAQDAVKAEQKDKMVNIGKFVSGSGRNIIAADAYLEAETRGRTTALNDEAYKAVERAAREAAAKYGVTVRLEKAGEAETTGSSSQLICFGEQAAAEMRTADGFRGTACFEASEDVAFMMNRVQECGGMAAYYMFGTPLRAEHHQNRFDFDEEVMRVMVDFYARLILD